MVEFTPVRAWHPNPKVVDPDETVCPVYDTLSELDFARFVVRPFNAARFVPRRQTTTLQRFLATAKEELGRALEAGAYIRDEAPGFYVYGIQYRPPPDISETIPTSGRRSEYLLLGLVGALDFDSIQHGQVALHEHTFPDRVDERAALTDATGMSFAPIVAGYNQPGHELNALLESTLGLDRRRLDFGGRLAPVVEARLDGTHHRLWQISDPALVRQLVEALRPLRLLILDGHHRFTAAAKRHYHGRPSAPLVMLVDGHDRALHVMPWHRVLHARQLDPRAFLDAVRREPDLAVRSLAPLTVEAAIGQLADMEAGHRRGFLAVTLEGALEVNGEPSTDAGADFDLLHAFLEDRLGIDAHDLEFVRSPRWAIEQIRKESPGTALLLPALSESGIEDRAFQRGNVMAHKSTMFLPKVVEGLIFASAAPGRDEKA
ncbi:MAG: DUF1015 family protein [Thermoplasmata archaeon]